MLQKVGLSPLFDCPVATGRNKEKAASNREAALVSH